MIARRRITSSAGPVLALLVAATAVAGCSGATTTATSSTAGSTSSAITAAPASAPRETRRPDESEGAFVFRSQCAGCHGTHGEGNLGPALVGIADRMTEVEQLALVRAGKGRMPPFAPGLSDDEIAAVVAYTRRDLR